MLSLQVSAADAAPLPPVRWHLLRALQRSAHAAAAQVPGGHAAARLHQLRCPPHAPAAVPGRYALIDAHDRAPLKLLPMLAIHLPVELTARQASAVERPCVLLWEVSALKQPCYAIDRMCDSLESCDVLSQTHSGSVPVAAMPCEACES